MTGSDFSVEHFQRLLMTTVVGRDCLYYPVVGSTMDVARELAVAGRAHGALVVAGEQRAGKGRFGRRWLTPPGGNLAFSLLVRPDMAHLKALAMIASLAIVRGVERQCGLACDIKWPNDVQVRGRKLAGVLIDSEFSGESPDFAIIGAGINVNVDPAGEPEIAEIATSVLKETGRTHDREALLAGCLNELETLYLAPVAEAARAWRAALNTIGRQVQVKSGSEIHEGRAVDVTPDGELLLRTQDGAVRAFAAGEVTLRS